MNIEDVVLVRATDELPMNGVIMPASSGRYLTTNIPSDFKKSIRKYLKPEIENELGRNLDLWNNEDRITYERIADSYYPLTSKYNSTLSFSFNGLVPDDINNIFSNRNIAIIEPLKYHLNEKYLNIDVIDTTIKGSVTLSNEAILLIREEYFNSLNEDVKLNLQNSYNIQLFQGDLKQSINSTLEANNYKSFNLVLDKTKNDIEDSPNKNGMIAFEDEFAKRVSASRLKLQQLYTYPTYNMEEIDKSAALIAQEDIEKNSIIVSYYQNAFYSFLLDKATSLNIYISDEDKFYLLSNFDKSSEVLDDLVKALINSVGLEGLKSIVTEFNKSINDNYLNNEEILNNLQETR